MVLHVSYLYNWLVLSEYLLNLLEHLFENLAQSRSGCVPTNDPNDLRWRTETHNKFHEISILCNYYCVRLARPIENFLVFRSL